LLFQLITMSTTQDTSQNGAELSPDYKLEDNEPRLGPDGEPAPKTDEEYAVAQLTLRAIVSSKEAGVIIGKGGKNVADLRDETGVKAGVSKVVQGVHDRVLTITGGCEAISRAYAIVARSLMEGAPPMGMGGVVQAAGTHRKLHLLGFVVLYNTNKASSRVEATYFSQPDGHNHWQTGSEDQAHSGCVRRAYGCTERDASPID
jgi:heterogeneous nuclear rnp K-like protein 2